MSRSFTSALILIVLSGGFLYAADQPADQASAPGPTMVLPQVTLDIQDLSVEHIQAMLPPARESPISQMTVPLPASPELAAEEPARQLAVEGSDPLGGTAAAQRPLATQATLGAGSQDRVVGRFNVTTVGGSTHTSLSFAHETADGISGKSAGSGYDTRDDTLAGSLSGKLGPVDGSFQGSYAEKSFGLQGQSTSYISRLGRALDGSAGLHAQPLDWLSVDGKVTGAADSLTLAGSSPGQGSEYKGTAHLAAGARTGIFTIGLSGDYGYRVATPLSLPADQIQRVRPGLFMSLDFPGSILLEGNVGWFWNSQGLSVFPFTIHLTGATLSIFTFDLSFGYRVITWDQEDIFALSPYLVPLALVDDNGWSGDAAVQLALSGGLSLKVGASFMNSASMPTAPAVDPATGLFTVQQQAATRLTGDTSLRWIVTPGVTLDVRWRREFMDRPSFAPLDQITGEAIAMESSGAYGGQIAATVLTESGFTPVPVIDIGGFVRLSEAAQLHLDLFDILWPLLGGPRYGPSLSPYVEPGFRAVASVRLSLRRGSMRRIRAPGKMRRVRTPGL